MDIQAPNEPVNRQNIIVSSLLPREFTEKALLALPDRAREIITKRYDLNGEGDCTLEKIGQLFKITRERVRQIEKGSLAKIRENYEKEISEFNSVFQGIISKNGGAAEESFFLDKILEFMEAERGNKLDDREAEKRSLILVLAMIGEIRHNLKNRKMKDVFYIDSGSLAASAIVIGEAIKVFEEEKKTMKCEDVFDKVKGKEALKEKNINLTTEALNSYLVLSREVGMDKRGLWGLASWLFVFPKSVRDKAYLVLFYGKEPLHFKKIAQSINESWTKKKKPALAETVHNELIKDKRFVLVGRGIYALAEWGYERGTVRDIIKAVLSKSGRLMDKDEIIREVSSQRMVKPSTIILNLKDKEVFETTEEGKYRLKN